MNISINNPSIEGEERTVLTDPINASATNIPVKSSQGLDANEYIYVGEPAHEKTELRQISAIVDVLNVTTDATSYSHSEGDPVITSRWNQIKIYKATSLTGTYSLLTTVAIDVDNPLNVTVYDDTVGLSTDYYKITYYNSTSTAESTYSDPIPGSGVSYNTVRYVTDQILTEGNDTGESVTSRQEILDWMNECSADIKARRRKWSFLYTRAVASTVADQEYYDIGSDFAVTDVDKIDHLEYNYTEDSSDLMYRLRYVTPERFDILHEDRSQGSNDSLQVWTFDEAMDYIRIWPAPATANSAALYLYYYKDIPYLDSDGDTFTVPETRLYKHYCLAQLHLKKGDDKMHDKYMMKYEGALGTLQRQQRREVGQPRGFNWSPNSYRDYFKY
jgi:hypothetical protein